MDKIMIREEMIEATKLLAIPIDFDQLISDGIIIKQGAWYKIPDIDKLPPHAGKQIQSFQPCSGKTMMVKFSKRNKSAQKLYKKLTGKEYDQE